MKLTLPRKRTLLAWHRWVGFASALFLVILSLTGLVLNHTEFFKLDAIQVRNDFILSRYGMEPATSVRAYRIQPDANLAHLGGQLFYNSQALCSATQPKGIIHGEHFTAIATAEHLIYLTREGALIEQVGASQLPYHELLAVGRTAEGQAVLIGDTGNWLPDADWIHFQEYSGAYQVEPLAAIALPKEELDALLTAFQGAGVPLYRVLLDLHSGRLFGWGGRTLMDLSALAILLLISSGISGWLRKSRQPPTHRST